MTEKELQKEIRDLLQLCKIYKLGHITDNEMSQAIELAFRVIMLGATVTVLKENIIRSGATQ